MVGQQLAGKWPAVVAEWNRERRECRVEIPGLTDGAEVLPLAEIAYPIGDKSEHTEIWIEVGDRVWVEFMRGDARYPVITHFRPKQAGNQQLWRRFEHENHEREAFDGDIWDHATQDVKQDAGRDILTTAGRNETKTVAQVYKLTAGTKIELVVGGTKIELTDGLAKVTTQQFTVQAPQSTFTGNVTIQGNQVTQGTTTAQGALTAQSGASVTGTMTNNGKDVGSNHRHSGQASAPSGPVTNTGTPI